MRFLFFCNPLPNPAICRRSTAKGYEDFYFPLVEENRLGWVTQCTSGAVDCQRGQCLVEKSGPAGG